MPLSRKRDQDKSYHVKTNRGATWGDVSGLEIRLGSIIVSERGSRGYHEKPGTLVSFERGTLQTFEPRITAMARINSRLTAFFCVADRGLDFQGDRA
jgi:hypothetical protein